MDPYFKAESYPDSVHNSAKCGDVAQASRLELFNTSHLYF